MLRAIISDIHANLEALRAVVADIGERGVEEVICLGDVVGYGPNPLECIELVEKTCLFTVLGNHDEAVLFDPSGFNEVALRTIYWTREQMEAGRTSDYDYFDFVGDLQATTKKEHGNALYVHGSPRKPTHEYMKPEYASDSDEGKRMDASWKRFAQHAFCGHTHLPGYFSFDGTSYHWTESTDLPEGKFRIEPDCKRLINVGSVGQPRDSDARACYLLWDDESHDAEYVRVPYDFSVTVEKIKAIPELHERLWKRLKVGR